MKLKITDPNGVHFGGKILPVDSEHEIAKGPHTDAWLRFGQAKAVKEKEEPPAKDAGPKK